MERITQRIDEWNELGQWDNQGIVRQSFSGRAKGGETLAGGWVVEANGQVVYLAEILSREGMDVLDNFVGLPDAGGVMVADRRPISLTTNKAVGGAEVDEDGVVGG